MNADKIINTAQAVADEIQMHIEEAQSTLCEVRSSIDAIASILSDTEIDHASLMDEAHQIYMAIEDSVGLDQTDALVSAATLALLIEELPLEDKGDAQ